jgi:thiamine biosynthesis lipoprotein
MKSTMSRLQESLPLFIPLRLPCIWLPLIILGSLFGYPENAAGQKNTSSPHPKPVLLSFQQPSMGTLFTIRLWASPTDSAKAQTAADAAFTEIKRLNFVFSDYELDSELLRITQNPKDTWLPVSEDFFNILSISQQLALATDGAFDVTAGPHIRNWRLSKRDRRLPRPNTLEDAFSKSGYRKLTLDPKTKMIKLASEEMRLDLGGIAKGYAADAALAELKQQGFPQAIVAGSGDIVTGDPPPGHPGGWAIGIRSLDREDSEKLTETVLLAHSAVSTSGDSQQFLNIDGVRYSHIVNPKTGLGLTERIAVTIIGPNAVTTDSAATAVSVMGKKRGLAWVESRPDLECLIVEKDADGVDHFTESSGFGAKRKQ